ncbi:hypothetical protein WN943_022680 [Citrus x changshan-huyou]
MLLIPNPTHDNRLKLGLITIGVLSLERTQRTLQCNKHQNVVEQLIDKSMLDMAKKYDEEMFAKGLPAKPREELIGDEAGARRIGR